MEGLDIWFALHMSWFWLLVCAIAVAAELATSLALVSIWFAGGAVLAMFAAMLGMPDMGQWFVFALSSLVMLVVFRRRASAYVRSRFVRTNADRIIGKEGLVRERISNLDGTGSIVVGGQEWTARTKEDGIVLNPGETVRICAISGVKAIVKAMPGETEEKRTN